MAAKGRTRAEDELSFSRIVAFSDGVFAIAITLLVLQIQVPSHIHSASKLTHALTDQSSDLIAYAISFAVIGRFWVSHHRFFSNVRSFDSRLLALNLLFLAFVVLIPYSSQVLGEYGGKAPAVILYAGNLALVTLVSALMCTYVLRVEHTDPDRVPAVIQGRSGSLFAAGIFLLSMPIALVTPLYAPYVWLLLFFDPSDRKGSKA